MNQASNDMDPNGWGMYEDEDGNVWSFNPPYADDPPLDDGDWDD